MQKNKLIYKLELWETISLLVCLFVLVIIISLDFICISFYQNYPLTLSGLIGLTSCIITAISILYFQKIYRNKKLYNHYSKIEGKYIRSEIGQDNTLTEKLDILRAENNGLYIVLTYEGENKFSADMEYWKSDNARAKGIIEFNETNRMIASGTYKYYKGENFKDHFGTLDLFCFEDNPKRIYVKYQHIFPREPPQQPDDNRGWQVWEKQKIN